MYRKYNNSSGISGFLMQNRLLLMYSIMTVALIGFEMFNFSTTQYALNDVLGELSFAGLQWATILSIAFCGIDFAGIARLFTPTDDGDPTREVWYLFGAWLLAATMNAILTWWGVSMALQGRDLHSSAIIDKKLMMQVVPVFVAVMVWVTRVLLIGSFSFAMRQSQKSAPTRTPAPYRSAQPIGRQPVQAAATPYHREVQSAAGAAVTRSQPLPAAPSIASLRPSVPTRPEPEYIPDGEAHAPSPSLPSLPSLRPMAASARPSASNQERHF
jgi:hypothetical protein